jgi:hypothetical protein
MRLEAQIKRGYYPLPLEAIPGIAQIVSCDPEATIFDPCCGEGVAVVELAKALGQFDGVQDAGRKNGEREVWFCGAGFGLGKCCVLLAKSLLKAV